MNLITQNNTAKLNGDDFINYPNYLFLLTEGSNFVKSNETYYLKDFASGSRLYNLEFSLKTFDGKDFLLN